MTKITQKFNKKEEYGNLKKNKKPALVHAGFFIRTIFQKHEAII